jgi:hypothetical protein
MPLTLLDHGATLAFGFPGLGIGLFAAFVIQVMLVLVIAVTH